MTPEPAGRLEARLDDGTGPDRIGAIIFDEDLTSEDELARLRGAQDISVHISRMPLPTDASPAGLARTLDDLAAAASRLVPSAPLGAIAYGCTTGTLELGYEAVVAAIARGRPGATPVATPITGAVKAFAALGVSRISLLTPYAAPLNRLIVDHLALASVRTLNLAAFAVEREIDFARVSLPSLRDGALSAMHPEAEALFVSCTALRVGGLIDELETALGRPVVTSTQALWWEALQLAGRQPTARGGGRLLAP
ncbi:MAG: hypothetical protein P4L73_17170 [Caulobacteraceae bacterium]|nr:hypothetical protein [Caulobacteraceae bacterium]